jgi:hypothetical protein
MTDLRVHAPTLGIASASVLRSASGVRLEAEFSASAVDILGSDVVERALRLGSQQQSQRSVIAADTLARVGAAPTSAAAEFAEADSILAHAL